MKAPESLQPRPDIAGEDTSSDEDILRPGFFMNRELKAHTNAPMTFQSRKITRSQHSVNRLS